MRLLSLYKSILESLNVTADSLGLLTHTGIDGQTDPVRVMVNGANRRLTLPTPELLRAGIPDELVAFHPLSEISNRGESEVFRKLKALVSIRLTTAIMAVMDDLTVLAADKAKHSSLPPKLHKLLAAMPNVDEKLVDSLRTILGLSVQGGKNRLISIYMNRGGTYMGKKHARVAVVNFPILEELEDPDRKVFGVQLRKKDVPQIKALFDLVLPNSDIAGTFNAASDSMDAPYFESLMLAYGKVAGCLNDIIKIASKYIDDASSLKMDLQWLGELNDIDKMRFEIPALEGNKGNSPKGANEPDEVEQSVTAMPVQTPAAQQAPAAVPHAPSLPAATTSGLKEGFSSEQLRANINAMQANSSVPEPFRKLGPEAAPTYSSGGRKFSDLAPPVQPMAPAPGMMGYPMQGYQPNYGVQPMAAPVNYGYGQPVQDPFTQVNTMYNRPAPVNNGWGNAAVWTR